VNAAPTPLRLLPNPIQPSSRARTRRRLPCSFLDAQRIHALTSYLEALHARGLAGADHTTLLLNCYTKLRDVEKLDAFIHGGGSGAAVGAAAAAGGGAAAAGSPARGAPARGGKAPAPACPGFDPETAFRVLRGAGYFGHALAVAARAGQAEWRLDVLLEDTQQYDDAIRFIGGPRACPRGFARWAVPRSGAGPCLIPGARAPPACCWADLRPSPRTARAAQRLSRFRAAALARAPPPPLPPAETLPRPQRASALQRYGKSLINARPEDTTRILMDLCLAPEGAPPQPQAGGGSDSGFVASVSDFSQLYTERPTALMLLCEFVINRWGSRGGGPIQSSGGAPRQRWQYTPAAPPAACSEAPPPPPS
jgi:hypothetical protein